MFCDLLQKNSVFIGFMVPKRNKYNPKIARFPFFCHFILHFIPECHIISFGADRYEHNFSNM